MKTIEKHIISLQGKECGLVKFYIVVQDVIKQKSDDHQ